MNHYLSKIVEYLMPALVIIIVFISLFTGLTIMSYDTQSNIERILKGVK